MTQVDVGVSGEEPQMAGQSGEGGDHLTGGTGQTAPEEESGVEETLGRPGGPCGSLRLSPVGCVQKTFRMRGRHKRQMPSSASLLLPGIFIIVPACPLRYTSFT